MSNTRNRIISQSQAIFVGPTPATGVHSGDIYQLHRIQSEDHGFSVKRQEISQYGVLAPIDRAALEAPAVDLSFSYLCTDVINESRMGLTVNLATSVLSGILSNFSDEKNYFILTVPEGNDADGFAYGSGSVIGIGNGFLNSYSIEGSVGNFPIASVKIEGLNMKGYASGINQPIPAVNPLNGNEIVGVNFTLPQATSGSVGQATALRPGDITLNLGSAALFVDLSGISVQSFNCSFDLNREPVQALGYKYARSKEVQFPINVNFNVDVLAGDLTTGSISTILCDETKYDASIVMKKPSCDGSGDVAVQLTLKNIKLESQQYKGSIGPAQAISIQWVGQIGGPQDLANGLYLSGVDDYGTGASYSRTAFVSDTPGGAPALNDISNPYPTMDDAVSALASAYSGLTTTVRLLSNTSGVTGSSELDEVLTAGLKIMGHGTTYTVNGPMGFGTQTSALLTLENVEVEQLIKPDKNGGITDAGTIHGVANVTIGEFIGNGASPAAGTNGSTGGTNTGSPHYPGGLPKPDTVETGGGDGGNAGGDADSGGTPGAAGDPGGDAWRLILTGSGTMTNLVMTGGDGADGGNGGAGGTANGGHGQSGGDTNDEAEFGGGGGAGGSASANGGAGGDGGNGGNGGVVIYEAGWSIVSSDVTGGLGGSVGTGGAGGIANAGGGGVGGDGGAGAGSDGDAGSSSADAGANGTTPGSDGSDGSLTLV
jgi:hypothetical protein